MLPMRFLGLLLVLLFFLPWMDMPFDSMDHHDLGPFELYHAFFFLRSYSVNDLLFTLLQMNV